jgi:hypothetical protein
VGITIVLDYFLKIGPLNDAAAALMKYVVLIGYLAVALGLINIYFFHVRRVTRQSSQWMFSAWLIIVTSSVTLIGIFAGRDHAVYSFLFKNVYSILAPAGYGIMTFFMASAAFRALRVRTIEALVLAVSIIATLLYRAPFGALIPGVMEFGDWISAVPSAAGMRGIIIGMALGAIGMGLRTMIGYERGHLPE